MVAEDTTRSIARTTAVMDDTASSIAGATTNATIAGTLTATTDATIDVMTGMMTDAAIAGVTRETNDAATSTIATIGEPAARA